MFEGEWKKAQEGTEFKGDEFALKSGFYEETDIAGEPHYRITAKGRLKVRERKLDPLTHNFLLYLNAPERYFPTLVFNVIMTMATAGFWIIVWAANSHANRPKKVKKAKK